MESNKKIELDINDLYKILKIHDKEILKKYNQTEISDKDYFFYAINNDLISNSLNIIINYLSNNLNSAGVDNSCRTIIETLTIFAMDAKGDISDLQKTIYRYSYSLVDLDNFYTMLDEKNIYELKNDESTKQIFNDAEKCKNAIVKHFNCSIKDLNNKKIALDDPCFYLQEKLTKNIKFSKLVEKYLDNPDFIKMYNFFFNIYSPQM